MSTFKQNYRSILNHRFPTFESRGLFCCVDVDGHLTAETGTSKSGGGCIGLHTKTIGCDASEVYDELIILSDTMQ